MLSYENIQLDVPYEVICIESIYFIAQMNDHQYLTLDVTIEATKLEEYITNSTEGKQIKVLLDGKIIYVGKVIKLQAKYNRRIARLIITAASYSYDLDLEKHQAVFNNLNMTYDEVIKKVLSNYKKKDSLDKVTEGKCIPHLLVQYKETDWEFLKRLATHFETVLEVDAVAPSGCIYFGYEPRPIEKEAHQGTDEVFEGTYAFKDSMINYETFHKIKGLTEEDLYEQSFIGWKVESKVYVPLGMEITYDGKKICVAKVEMQSIRGEIIFYYELKFRKAIRTNYTFNNKLQGASLEAIVKKRKDNEMQLHFCVNKTYEANGADQWFQYGREVSNFYCMPVEESKVHVLFLVGDEQKAIISHGIRIASPKEKYYNKIANPDHKSYSTVDGQELSMTPDAVQLAEDDGKKIQFTLTKEGNVSITAQTINIYANGKMEVGTKAPYHPKSNPTKPKTITISVKNKLVVTKSPNDSVNVSHSIELNEQNHMRGNVRLQE